MSYLTPPFANQLPSPHQTSLSSNLIWHGDVIKWKHFRVTGPLCGESIGHRWIPLPKPMTRSFWCFLWSTKVSIKNWYAGDPRRYCPHYNFTVMTWLETALRPKSEGFLVVAEIVCCLCNNILFEKYLKSNLQQHKQFIAMAPQARMYNLDKSFNIKRISKQNAKKGFDLEATVPPEKYSTIYFRNYEV